MIQEKNGNDVAKRHTDLDYKAKTIKPKHWQKITPNELTDKI